MGQARKCVQGLKRNGLGRPRTVGGGLAAAQGGGRDKWGVVESDHRRPETPGRDASIGWVRKRWGQGSSRDLGQGYDVIRLLLSRNNVAWTSE